MKNKYLILCSLVFILLVASGCEKKAQSKDRTDATTTSASSTMTTSNTVATTKNSTETTVSSGEILTQNSRQSRTKNSSEIQTETSSKTTTKTSAENTLSTSTEISSNKPSLSSTAEPITSESAEQELGLNLGIIYYEHLDENDPIQANAKYLGCYIVDDGEVVNFVPLMSATVQNLYEYTSGQGNEDYYQQFINIALETSNLTSGKPVSILDREGGIVIISAQGGKVTYSL